MKVTVTTKELLDALKTIEGSLNTKINNILSNVCVKIKDGYLELVATDGNSLTIARINPQFNDVNYCKDLFNVEFIFELDKLKKVIDKTSRVVELDFNSMDDSKTLTITNNGLSIVLPSVQGKYPQYEQLMPYNDDYNKIKRDGDVINIGVTKKLLLDILRVYDSKEDFILEFEIKDNLSYIGIQPKGINNGKKYTVLMPVLLR